MNTTNTNRIKPIPLAVAVAVLAIGCSSLAMIGRVSAAPLTQSLVRLDKLKYSTTTGGRVCAKTSNAGVEGKVVVTFPTNSATDYVVQAVGNWTVSTATLDAGQTAWPGITAATSVTSKSATFPSGDLISSALLYCFNFGSGALTTASNNVETATGSIQTQTAASAALDTGAFSEGLTTDDTITIANQVVPPSFAFSLSGNTDAFSSNTLSTAIVNSTAGRTVTVTTNAASGYILWARDANNNGAGRGSLQSITASAYIAPNGAVGGGTTRTLSAPTGTPDYGLGTIIAANPGGGGTLTLNANYDSSASAVKIGTLDPTGFQPIASSNGTASGDQVTLTERAVINGQTKAASDYGDIITVVGAGLF